MRKRDLVERFWENVDTSAGPDGCWLWTGYARCAGGYGGISVGRRTALAHRVAWELAHGSLDKTMCVLHRCDNPRCVNVAHLFLGTRGDNNRDRAAKGRNGDISGDRNFIRRHPERAARGEATGHAKLTRDAVAAARAEYAAGGVRMVDIAAKYGVAYPTIQKALRRRSWAHV
jgi:hypothetical protein